MDAKAHVKSIADVKQEKSIYISVSLLRLWLLEFFHDVFFFFLMICVWAEHILCYKNIKSHSADAGYCSRSRLYSQYGSHKGRNGPECGWLTWALQPKVFTTSQSLSAAQSAAAASAGLVKRRLIAARRCRCVWRPRGGSKIYLLITEPPLRTCRGWISTLLKWQRIRSFFGGGSWACAVGGVRGRVLTWARDPRVLTFLGWNAWLVSRFMSHTFSASSESCTLTIFLHFFSPGPMGSGYTRRFPFLFFFSLTPRGNVLHAGKQMCVCLCMYSLAVVHRCVRACLCMFSPQLVLKHGRKSIVRTFSWANHVSTN